MPYKIRRTLEFRNQYLKLTRKNKSLQSKIDNKTKQIAANPTRIGKPKTGDMKYTYGSHVADHFVIVYMLISNNIIFLYVDHHDLVYQEAPRILENIEIEFPELWSVMSADLKRHLKR
jgi:mRNA-degrading endonuclease RelE of RelBE toxin-antitoxin system